ncbi:MAG: class I SAM-dependent methyltransferase [Oleiphilaceae bacterium]|nr:class I SAM-dependent methyltransferase [Oleiphilaceae bacterium]
MTIDVRTDDDDSLKKIAHYQYVQKQLEGWFQTSAGRELLADQRRCINGLIERNVGVHQAELCVSHRIPVGNASGLGHRFYVVPNYEVEMPNNTLVCQTTDIALPHDSADLVIMHHALDFSPSPHQTLRETSRILKSNGTLVLIGFNPLSLWGLAKLANRSRSGIWMNRFLSGNRVADWLTLLDFKIESHKYHFYAPTINRPGLAKRFAWIESVVNAKVPLGAYYVIMARKQQLGLINTSRRWARKPNVIGLPVANRQSRNSEK